MSKIFENAHVKDGQVVKQLEYTHCWCKWKIKTGGHPHLCEIFHLTG